MERRPSRSKLFEGIKAWLAQSEYKINSDCVIGGQACGGFTVVVNVGFGVDDDDGEAGIALSAAKLVGVCEVMAVKGSSSSVMLCQTKKNQFQFVKFSM
ncbi:hypothetical protein Ddye_006839 [Dipteronia dyeriana]|uniref:Uncharacterized protein n=1 Tax=Dipteronia dyeriana TaxID=168575 RepID=A0AAD9XJD5_9ROSI|nr:hypothetical protein Ddye_006839 [Dipteronia dyeriana]